MTDTVEVLEGFNTILMGASGTGKTHAIGTLVDTGLEVFYIPLESGTESLIGYYTDKGQPVPDNLHIHALYDGYLQLLTSLNDFTDNRTGEKFGPADTWGTDRVVVVDGLTGLNNFAMQLVIGGRAERTQTDWGVAQSYVMSLLRKLTDGCRCHFVLIAHVERETDLVLGGVKLTVSTLGKAIAGTIPPLFSDVVLTKKDVDKFFWSTAEANADVKNRNLPLKAGQAPSFAPLYQKWLERSKGMQSVEVADE